MRFGFCIYIFISQITKLNFDYYSDNKEFVCSKNGKYKKLIYFIIIKRFIISVGGCFAETKLRSKQIKSNSE